MKLIDKSAIVAEIERKMNLCKKILLRSRTRQNDDYHQGNIDAYEVVISLLDTLEVKEVGVDFGDPQGDIGVKWVQEEPVSNDLEEAARKAATWHSRLKGDIFFENDFQKFIAGAEWQKEQMITKACNYLFSHMSLFVTSFDDDIVENIERSEFIKKFRIAMEDKT